MVCCSPFNPLYPILGLMINSTSLANKFVLTCSNSSLPKIHPKWELEHGHYRPNHCNPTPQCPLKHGPIIDDQKTLAYANVKKLINDNVV